MNKEVFVKHEKAPTAPRFEGGIDYLVYARVLEIQSFWTILANLRWPQLSKGTSIRQDLSYEPIPRSLRPSVAVLPDLFRKKVYAQSEKSVHKIPKKCTKSVRFI